MAITQTLTSPPALPDRLDNVNFSGQVATYLSWESTSRGELINWTTQANDLAAQCDADAVTAATSTAMLNSAILTVNASKWISGTTYSIGDVRWSPTTYLVYRRKTAGAGTTDPTSDSTNWQKLDMLPDQTGNSGKILSTNGTISSWTSIKTYGGVSLLSAGDISPAVVYKTSSGSWTATSTMAKVTVVGGGRGGGGGNATAGGTTSFVGPSTVSASSDTSSGGDISFNGVPAMNPNSSGYTLVGGVSTGGSQYGQGGSGSLGGNAGGAGITSVKYYNNLVIGTSYTCTVGAGGTGNGGAGSAGLIIIET